MNEMFLLLAHFITYSCRIKIRLIVVYKCPRLSPPHTMLTLKTTVKNNWKVSKRWQMQCTGEEESPFPLTCWFPTKGQSPSNKLDCLKFQNVKRKHCALCFTQNTDTLDTEIQPKGFSIVVIRITSRKWYMLFNKLGLSTPHITSSAPETPTAFYCIHGSRFTCFLLKLLPSINIL